jgi:dTDP-glucose pyrophosphorylase
MADLKDAVIGKKVKIIEALNALDRSGLQILLIVSETGILIGTLTDGDVRRGILRGISLESTVDNIMNGNPFILREGDTTTTAIGLMRSHQIRHMPVIDASGRPLALRTIDELIGTPISKASVVIMAGGLGKRLRPLTENIPKPMIEVGGRPILETMLSLLANQGFRSIWLCVNYKAEIIRAHFANGERLGLSIQYIQETKELGTAGPLSLLPEPTSEPLIVINGDILTTMDFNNLLDFHNLHSPAATLCVRRYTHQVPYGVVQFANDRLLQIQEKPMHAHFVSAGIYVLAPHSIGLLEPNQYCDMPTLMERLVGTQMPPLVYPIHEYWVDIGRIDDLNQASNDFSAVFN